MSDLLSRPTCATCRAVPARWTASRGRDSWPVCDRCKRQGLKDRRSEVSYVELGAALDHLPVDPAPPLEPAEASLFPIDSDTAPVGHDHPDTAKAAARRVLPRTGSRRRRAYDLIAGSLGMTAEEVGKRMDLPHQSYSATVSTLARDGWLRDSGRRRPTDAGNPAIVYEAVRR